MTQMTQTSTPSSLCLFVSLSLRIFVSSSLRPDLRPSASSADSLESLPDERELGEPVDESLGKDRFVRGPVERDARPGLLTGESDLENGDGSLENRRIDLDRAVHAVRAVRLKEARVPDEPPHAVVLRRR